MEYLVEWAFELVGRSGEGMNGPSPLSYGTIAHWARLTGADPSPAEVEALFALDTVIRHPDRGQAAAPAPDPAPARNWPAKKVETR